MIDGSLVVDHGALSVSSGCFLIIMLLFLKVLVRLAKGQQGVLYNQAEPSQRQHEYLDLSMDDRNHECWNNGATISYQETSIRRQTVAPISLNSHRLLFLENDVA